MVGIIGINSAGFFDAFPLTFPKKISYLVLLRENKIFELKHITNENEIKNVVTVLRPFYVIYELFIFSDQPTKVYCASSQLGYNV